MLSQYLEWFYFWKHLKKFIFISLSSSLTLLISIPDSSTVIYSSNFWEWFKKKKTVFRGNSVFSEFSEVRFGFYNSAKGMRKNSILTSMDSNILYHFCVFTSWTLFWGSIRVNTGQYGSEKPCGEVDVLAKKIFEF